MKFVRKYLKYLGLIVLVFILSNFIVNAFSYFDMGNFCYIDIEGDILRGNEETVKKAIGLLKKEDYGGYKVLCKYVDTISENYCLEGHMNYSDKPGCYIRGSKVIYIKPEKNDTSFIVSERANTIKKYSILSKNFWDK